MKLMLNGEPRQFEEENFPSVEALLEALSLNGNPVLVELNGKALLRQEFLKQPVGDGDEIEIIRMVAGG